MPTYEINGANVKTRAAFWEQYVSVVQPVGAEDFGRNLDALNDALAGGPGFPGENCILRIKSADEMSRCVGTDFIMHLRDIFDNSESATLELL